MFDNEVYALVQNFMITEQASKDVLAMLIDCAKVQQASLQKTFSNFLAGESNELLGRYEVKKPSALYVIGPLIGGVSGWWFATYDDLVSSLEEQFKSPENDSVVMVIDSPGGSVMGLFDACNAILALKKKYNKPLVGYAYTATSAAYALGSCCDHLVAGSHSDVGSIGVIAKVVDRTKQNEQMGLRVEVVRSGALKADPNPDVEITQASLDRVKSKIRAYAGDFEAFIEKTRGIKNALSLHGATFYGQKAIELKLIDSIGGLQDAIEKAMLLAQESIKTKKKQTMNETLKKLLGASDEASCIERVASLVAQEKTLVEALKQVEALKLEVASIEAKTIASFEARLASETKAKEEAKVKQVLIDAAVGEGRLSVAHLKDESYKTFLLGLTQEKLSAHLAVLPKLVATEQVEPRASSKKVEPQSSEQAAFSVDALAKKFGLKQEFVQAAIENEPSIKVALKGLLS